MGESKIFPEEVVGEGTLQANREMPSTEIRNYRCGGRDPTKIPLKPKGVR